MPAAGAVAAGAGAEILDVEDEDDRAALAEEQSVCL